jgi:hypothetical protein
MEDAVADDEEDTAAGLEEQDGDPADPQGTTQSGPADADVTDTVPADNQQGDSERSAGLEDDSSSQQDGTGDEHLGNFDEEDLMDMRDAAEEDLRDTQAELDKVNDELNRRNGAGLEEEVEDDAEEGEDSLDRVGREVEEADGWSEYYDKLNESSQKDGAEPSADGLEEKRDEIDEAIEADKAADAEDQAIRGLLEAF